ncbi:MAG: RsmF rRNA methyltransferase first C-terminal domain-containing protein [Clostridia bacterium]|nr:RsmF rRNA methyltransferase first C-terminal domain-containing protein [Clostridia bacterium]
MTAHNLPLAYIEQMKRLLGDEEFEKYLAALDAPVTKALRINLLRCPDGMPPCDIEGLGEAVPWAKGAYFVDGDARPGLSPLHEGGLYYLQEPSALSSASVLDAQPGERVLDLCAAPGGKSTQLAAQMQGQGVIVCNEPIPSRAQILSRNIERMGVRNAVVTCAYPAQLAPHFPAFFDKIMVDAPCSGEGMFRRQIEAREEWQENSPRGCADRQLEILEEAAKMLAPGGRMVYSTCTFNDTENEGVLARFLALHPEFSLVPFALAGLPAAEKGYLHLYPHEIRGEGHFVSLLEKSTDAPAAVENAPQEKRARKNSRMLQRAAKTPPAPQLPDVLAPGVTPGSVHAAGDSLWAMPQGIDAQRLSGLRVLRTGLLLARSEGKRFEPDHALAMALAPQEAARSAELDHEQALAYQAGEALELGDLPAGYTLLCHRGVPLGWGKQAGGIMKNHYPKGLRRR